MPIIKDALASLIKDRVSSNLQKITGINPQAQQDPSYFKEFCTAVATGVASGSSSLSFTTKDTGVMGTPPVPGIGTGKGVIVNDLAMSEYIYTFAHNDLPKESINGAWPPASDDNGRYMKAMTDGVAEAIKVHFASSPVLQSAHPIIYTGSGQITPGSYSGLSESEITKLIISAAPRFQGAYWPKFAAAIAKGYVKGIHTKATGQVVIGGICVPNPPAQLCGIPSAGVGTGKVL